MLFISMAVLGRLGVFLLLLNSSWLFSLPSVDGTCNNILADIVFIMDSSGSVGAGNFAIMKTFVQDFVRSISQYISPNAVRLAVIRFDSSPATVFDLDDYLTAESLITAIATVPYPEGGTATDLALNLARDLMFDSSQGARLGVTKLAILMTDGQSNSPTDTAASAQQLRSAGARIMAVGIANANSEELNAVASDPSYVQSVTDFSSLHTIQEILIGIACRPVCSYLSDHCWPGDCAQVLAENCRCRTNFTLRTDTEDKRCQLSRAPEIATCRLTLRDARGNEVRSRTSGTSQHCSYQQDEFTNIHPTTLIYDLKADLEQAVGSYPHYVRQSAVGVTGFQLKVYKVNLSNSRTDISQTSINQTPVCSSNAASLTPAHLLECSSSFQFPSAGLADGERLCIETRANGGGFYSLQDFNLNPVSTLDFPLITSTRTLCFTHDSSRPQHCSSAAASPSCTQPPLQLSTRLTRSRDIRVQVPAWFDPVPVGGGSDRASGVTEYKLEVHGVDVANAFLVVQPASLMTMSLTGSPPYDVGLTLPAGPAQLYAVLLEVHDQAGNVAYARRLVMYDNSSQVVLDSGAPLRVASANPEAVRLTWHTSSSDPLCLAWKDHFYNDVFNHYDFFLPVQADTARGIAGSYDQTSGVLPVSGTPSARGVVKFEVSWRQDGGSPSPWQNVANVTAQAVCLPLSLQDGQVYDFTVRAYDIMNNSRTDDVRAHVDSTPPTLTEFGLRGRWRRAGLYVHGSRDLSSMELVLEGSDPHSGLGSIQWTLGTNDSSANLGSRAVKVQAVNTTCPTGRTLNGLPCYCPVVSALPCEVFQYNLTFQSLSGTLSAIGDHHRNYYITVKLRNNAGLITSSSVKVLVDVSPPTKGVAMEGDASEAELDFTSRDVLRVRWHSFADLESGVVMYRVVLAARCLTAEEMDAASNATEVPASSFEADNWAIFRLNSIGHYYTSVVAYNGALTPSPVACSDGLVYDTSAPRLLNVTLAHARLPPSLACSAPSGPGDVTVWAVNGNLTRAPLLSTASACANRCRRNDDSHDVSIDHWPRTVASPLGQAESDLYCRTLPMMAREAWISLPSDRLLMTWASEEAESQIEAYEVGAGSSPLSLSLPDLIPMTTAHGHRYFHLPHPGLGHGAMFYLFLRATSKNGLRTTLTLGPVLVDSTAPVVSGDLQAAVSEGYLVVTWLPEQLADPEQPAGTELKITFRVGHSLGFVTAFIEASTAEIADCRLQNTSLGGCLRYPVTLLREQDARTARAFFFQLHVQNAAGLLTSVNTSAVTLPTVMTSQGVVLDVLPAGQEEEAEMKDVDVIFMTRNVCVGWSHVSLSGASGNETVRMLVGVGTNVTLDDIIPFTAVDVTRGRTCLNATRQLPPYVRLYSVVKASTAHAWATFASDGFLLVPGDDPRNQLQVFVGRGCTSKDGVGRGTVPSGKDNFNSSDLSLSALLHAGDLLFFTFDPFIPNVTFDKAAVTLNTLTGYQVILGSNKWRATLPYSTQGNLTVRVYACRKEEPVLMHQKDRTPFHASWEMSGPWSALAYRTLVVAVWDLTCQQALTAANGSGSATSASVPRPDACLVGEIHLAAPHLTSASFPSLELASGRKYVTSLSLCLDDACAAPVTSRSSVFVTSQSPLFDLSSAAVVMQSSQMLTLQIAASSSGIAAEIPCVYFLALSRSPDASHLLSDWQLLADNQSCRDLQLNVSVAVQWPADGTVFLCARLIHPTPVASISATCRKVSPYPLSAQAQTFLVVEMDREALTTFDLSPYLTSQQLGSKVHDLYDLDLDFARSDQLLAALVTNSFGREVRWFLMEGQARLPKGDDCAADPACVVEADTSSMTLSGTVAFPRYGTKLRHGFLYYACALILPRTTDSEAHLFAGFNEEQRSCGDGFVVDDFPPLAGSVTINNADTGYLADGGVITVTWKGFSDVENDVTFPLMDDTTFTYFVALGSYPGAQDLANMTSVGRRTAWTFEGVHGRDGAACYATVRAVDRVGHVTEVTSQPVVLDNTPPSLGLLAAGSFTGDLYVLGQALRAHLHGVSDVHSGISAQWLGVSSQGGHDDVMPYFPVEGMMITFNASQFLLNGHSYRLVLKSTNRAGLTSVTSSEPFRVDSSAPEGGTVWNGAPGSNDNVRYMTDTHVYSIHWSDFADPHSGMASYKVGLGTSPGLDDVVPFHDVGLRTTYSWRRQFDQGRSYFAAVQGCNRVGLCTVVTSASLMFDNSPPSPGHVTVGTAGSHSHYYGHNTTLQIQWTGFADPQSGIRDYFWCVGRQPSMCDVRPFMTSLGARYVTSLAQLPEGVRLFVTVRALNHAGLSTESSSQWFVVDLTPPQLASAPFFLTPPTPSGLLASYDTSLLRVVWRFAKGGGVPIADTLVLVQGETQGRQVPQPVSVGADTHVTLPLGAGDALLDGDRYRVTVVTCNVAGLCSNVTSPWLLVDSSPPVVGRFEHRLPWRRAARTTTTLTSSTPTTSASDFSQTSAATSYSSNGLNSTTNINNNSASAFTTTATTTTAAISLTTTYIETQLEVLWTGFSDHESGVMTYHLTAGRSDSDTSLSQGVVRVAHNKNSTSGLQTFYLTFPDALQAGDLVVLSLWAENSVGLFSGVQRMTFEVLLDSALGNNGWLSLQRHSCAPLYCTNECTCAPEGEVCIASNAVTSCLEGLQGRDLALSATIVQNGSRQSFVTSAKCLEGQWSSTGNGSVLRFEYSFSLKGSSAGQGVMDPAAELVWRDAGLRTSAVYCLPAQRALELGAAYVLQLRAWLSAESYVRVTSDPVVADHTPPLRRRGKSVVESVTSSCGADVDVVTSNRTFVTACWAGVFTDTQSGVAYYDVWVGIIPYVADIIPETSVGPNTSQQIDVSVMTAGTRYYVSVRAWNGAGLSTTVVSDGVMLDVTPPASGYVFLASRHAVDHVTDDVTQLPVSWYGFQDPESGVTSYSVALYDVTTPSQPVVDYLNVGFATGHVSTGLSLRHGFRYKAAVKAISPSGLESIPAFSDAILVDVTAPVGATCKSFKLEQEVVLSVLPKAPIALHHRTYFASFMMDNAAENMIFKVVIRASNVTTDAVAEMTIEPYQTMPLHFRYNVSKTALAQHLLMTSTKGTLNVTVEVQANVNAALTAEIHSCVSQSTVTPSLFWSSTTLLSSIASSSLNDTSSDAVTVEQVSVNTVMVCSMIKDDDSGLMSLKVGLGTTPGGLQVIPLTPVGQAGHLLMEVTAQHGTVLYATAVAENHAQVLSRFLSHPVVFDTTPPVIASVRLNISYVRAASDVSAPSATALAWWTASDAESGGVICTCTLEGHTASDDAVQTARETQCQWRLAQPIRHGARVYAVVTCMNRVQISATLSSTQVPVLLHPPDLTQASPRFLYNFNQSSPFDHTTPLQVRSSHTDLEVSWRSTSDATTDHFSYRFLKGQVPVSGWTPLPAYKTAALLDAAQFAGSGNVTLELVAVDVEGLTSAVVSSSVSISDDPPSITTVQARVNVSNNELLLKWSGVFQTARDVIYVVYAGSLAGQSDVINQAVTESTTYSGPCDLALKRLYVLIQAVYASGLYETYRAEAVVYYSK